MEPTIMTIMSKLISLECWYVFSDQHSPDITLAMGNRVPRIPKLAQRWPEEDPRRYRGEYSLWISCPWRFEHQGKILATSADFGTTSNWFDEEYGRLVGSKIAGVQVLSPEMHLVLVFDNGTSIHAENTILGQDSSSMAWSLRGEERLLFAIGPKGRLLH